MQNTTPLRESINKEIESIETRTKDQPQEDKLDAVKDEFISIVSHELRTPMSTIKGYLNILLAGDAGPVPEKVREVLTEMLLAVEREIRLVNGMLDISRLESGRMPFVLKDNIDIAAQARLLLHSLKKAAQDKQLVLAMHTPKQALPKVQADTDKLIQVLINLVGNALKFTQKGEVSIGLHKDGDFVITCVTDTGPGIPIEKQKLLFEKFSQASSRKTRISGGSGLGLYISKNIIKKMGGDIWLEESEPEKGSTFCFTLPITRSTKAKEVAQKLRKEGNIQNE